jgi:hypothetical protein
MLMLEALASPSSEESNSELAQEPCLILEFLVPTLSPGDVVMGPLYYTAPAAA